MSLEEDVLWEKARLEAEAEAEAKAGLEKAAKESAEKEAKTALARAAENKTSEEKAAAEKAAAGKEVPEKTADEKTADEKTAGEKTADEKTENEKTENEKTADEGETTEKDEKEREKKVNDSVTLFLEFLDFAGKPIVGLTYRVVVGKTTYNGATNDKGHATLFSGLGSHQELEIFVKKDDGQFASKFKGFTACNDMSICAVSPHIKIELETELHKGAIGTAPTPKEKPTAIKAPAIPGAGQISGGGKHTETKPKTGRDGAGNPQAEQKEKTSDWNARHFIPTFLIWSWDDFKHKIGWTRPEIEINKDQTKPDGDKKAGATSATSPSTNGKGSAALKVSSLDQAVPEEVTELIKIMEEQATWKWDKMLKGTNSASIAAGLTDKSYIPITGKIKSTPVYRCYPSVKIGLLRAKLVSGINGDVPAKGAGPWLLAQGFKDVTKLLPDGRWAMPGDVIVYRYTDEIEVENLKKFEKVLKAYEKQKTEYAERKIEYKKELDIWTAGTSQRKNEEIEAKKKKKKYLSPKAPKLGAEPTRPDDENYGHIDVRSYDGYMSDFMAERLGKAERYVVTGIYRKVFDPLPDLRVRAFLKVLREWETHEEPNDSKRYFMLYKAINGSRRFTDTTTHPFESEGDKSATPAGAYQIIFKTYKGNTFPNSDIARGFSPFLQDRIAVRILEGRNALGFIRQGKIKEAVAKLTTEWSSLPGGVDARHETRNKTNYVFSIGDLLEKYNLFLAEEIKK